MQRQDFIDSVERHTKRLCDQIAEIENGTRRIIFAGEDISDREAELLRHQVTENITIIDRLRAGIGSRQAF